MIVICLLIFIVFPLILILAASPKDSNSSCADQELPLDSNTAEKKHGSNQEEDLYPDNGLYDDATYERAYVLSPEELRDEDPDLYDDMYGPGGGTPDGF